jgi:uracil-DNA glycosylase
MENIPNQGIPPIIHESWHEHLQPLFNDHKMILINTKVLPECHKFYPSGPDIFRVFAMPLDKIKVVILGQDPYPNGEAIGYSFAVNRATKLPASLKIIKNEIINSGVERDTFINIDTERWRELSHWRQQGVFLLNAALTVQAKVSGSHVGQWQWFTREVIKIISKEVTPVWMLWGAKAKVYKQTIKNAEIFLVNEILEADHPAAETYPGSTSKFTGCNHFNLCNKALKEHNQTIINW